MHINCNGQFVSLGMLLHGLFFSKFYLLYSATIKTRKPLREEVARRKPKDVMPLEQGFLHMKKNYLYNADGTRLPIDWLAH